MTLQNAAANRANPAVPAGEPAPPAKPSLYPSPGLGAWLNQSGGSLAFSTYQSARLLLLSGGDDGRTRAQERVMGTAMGLAVGKDCLWVANHQQVWRLSNLGPQVVGETAFDAVFMPRKGYFIGPCNTHDILAEVTLRGQQHELLLVNTQFSCIAAIDDHYNFRPLWKPEFISALATGDRCHLNGMCARDGELAYATLCGRSDESAGWKAMKTGGGCVVDIATNQVICDGLSMPHSPRWHQGRLWLLNSGTGDFGYVDFSTGSFVAIAQCPGFARGLAFVGDYAVIGLSNLRENTLASGLPIFARLEAQHIRQRCGLLVIDTRSGALVHWLTIEGVVSELYDVAFLAGIARPYTPGFSEPQLHHELVHAPAGELAIVPMPRDNATAVGTA